MLSQPMERNKSVDIAKGILISFLIMHSIIRISLGEFHLQNDLLSMLDKVQSPLFLCYFLPAFFLISGFCTNFERNWSEFIVRQFKTLLVPNIVFTICFFLLNGKTDFLHTIMYRGGWMWFLTALFVCKIVYYFIHKYIKNDLIVFIILLAASFLGTVLNDMDTIYNYWWHRQALDLLMFLAVGHWLKSHIHDDRIWFFVLGYIATVVVCHFMNIELPIVTAGFTSTKYNWILHIILATCGSVGFLKLCSFIRYNTFLEYLGINTLVIYMFHHEILYHVLGVFADNISTNTTEASIITILASWLTTIALCLAFGWLLNSRYFKWSLGKWSLGRF